MNKLDNQYRPEVDGLRAIAVLVILFYHAGIGWASGGFVGVDIFFVISGYLITRNISNEMHAGSFSFSGFYIKRIRRLFPALVFVFVITLCVAYLLFSPADLERLGHSLQYSVLSLSNFFFWQESGYFNSSSEIKPLLHTWSLGVEEQFYIVWPAILFGLSFFHKKISLQWFLISALVISLLLNYFYIANHSNSVFYLLPFRIFEFAIGALCFVAFIYKIENKFTIELFSFVGICMITYSVLFFDSSTIFPGFAALMPCVGTALIIISRNSWISTRMLSMKILVKIGLISYSVYLIHWPLLVFYKYWKFTDISLFEKGILMLLSVFFAYFMWKFIEKPFRIKKITSSKLKFWLMFVILITVIFVLAFITQYKKGWPQRYPNEYFMSQKELSDNLDRYWKDFTVINQNQSTENKNVIVMGNSHAVDLIYALRENGSKLNIKFFNTWFQCFNFGTPINNNNKDVCDKKLTRYLKNKFWTKTQAIYLHDHWPVLDLVDLNKRLVKIRALSSAPIYVFGPKMTYSKTIPSMVLSHMRMASLNEYSKQFSNHDHVVMVNRKVKEMIINSTIENLFFIDILSLQCGENIDNCEIISTINSKFMYFDYGHFTLQGAKELGKKLKTKYPHLFL